jgi:hypothetical protein
MSNPITSPTTYYELEKLRMASEALAKANGLHDYDPILRDSSSDRPLELGAASTNAIAHALSSAYLAYDHSAVEAAGLGWAREYKSYWLEPKRPAAWDTFKDLYNNQVGRNIADYVRSKNLSRDQIQDLVLDALSTGKLIVTQQDKRIDQSFNGNPGHFSVPVGDGAPWTAPSAGFSDFAPTVTRVPVALPNGLREPPKERRSELPDDPAPTSAQGALAATPASRPYTAGTGGVLGKFFLDSLITPAEAASPPAQGARLLTPYFPGQGSSFGDRPGNAAGVPSPDTPLRRVSSAFAGMTLPDPDPVSPLQPGRALGIFTGKPMPSWTTPPPLGGLLNNSSASGNNDGFNFPTGLVFRNSTPAEPPLQADSIPERRLARRTYSVSSAPAYDPGAAVAPLVPSDDANYWGGVLGRFAGKPGFDPQSQNPPAPPDDEQQQADLQALEAKFSSSGDINDAWALYNARKAGRR